MRALPGQNTQGKWMSFRIKIYTSVQGKLHIGSTSDCQSKMTLNVHTVKPVLSGHSKIDKMKVLKTDDSLMQA